MAGFSDTYENYILNLLLAAQPIPEIADNAGSSPSTAIWVALHTADPTDSGEQGSNEAAYTGYARAAVARTTGGFAVANGAANPVADIPFGQATSTSTGTITHASLGLTSASTGGDIIASGPISPNINFGQNVTPSLTTSSTFSLAD